MKMKVVLSRNVILKDDSSQVHNIIFAEILTLMLGQNVQEE